MVDRFTVRASKLIDPKSDFAFKKIFVPAENEEVLVRFLNDMLDFREGPPITSIKIRETHLGAHTLGQKSVILDVLCSDADGNDYIVDMQSTEDKENEFRRRALYYATQTYCRQLQIGEPYKNLKAVYLIAVLDFNLFADNFPMLSQFSIFERNIKEPEFPHLHLITLELKKFKKGPHDLAKLENKAEQWAYFFKYAECLSDEEWEEFVAKDNMFKRVYRSLNQASWTMQEYDEYEAFLKDVRDLDYLQRNLAAKKRAEGLAEGLAEGEAKGKAEEKLEMARNLLALGVEIDKISKASDLSLAEIANLQKKAP